MTSERIERQVVRLLDEAEAAVVSRDWGKVRLVATSALVLNPQNADAKALLDAAERGIIGVAAAEVSAPRKILLSPARVLVFSVLTAGFYVFYWTYLTWKQLKTETREDHYPVWHALSLLVPFYSWFRFHKHLDVVLEQAQKAGASSLSPPTGVLLLVAGTIAGSTSFQTRDVTAGVIALLASITFYTLVVLPAQLGLNNAWLKKYPASQNAGVSWVEVALALFGVWLWLATFMPE